MSTRELRLWLPTLLCVAALPFCALWIHPWAEVGINDDWSYNRTAQILATTGHIRYNGWATAMLGWQLYVGAALIKFFGFSFAITRVGTLLVAMFTAGLTQRLFVRMGATTYNSVATTLVLLLSPPFLVMTFSFMNDIYGLSVLIVCCYCCVRALQTRDPRAAAVWVCVAAVSNALGGTTRQIAWLGLVVMVPSTMWLLRRNRRVLWLGGVSTACGVLFVVAALHWYSRQPVVIVEPLRPRSSYSLQMFFVHMVPLFVRVSLGELLFLSVPVVLLFTPAIFRSRRSASLVGLAVLLGSATAVFLEKAHRLLKFCYPYMPSSIWFKLNYRHVGDAPFFVTPAAGVLLTAISFWAGLCLLSALLTKRPVQSGAMFESSNISPLRLGDVAVLLAPCLVGYLALLFIRFLSGGLYDRYYLFPEFVFLAFVTLLYQRRVQPRYPPAFWGLLAVMACCDVAGMHDLFSQLSAQVTLEQTLIKHGVPRAAIDGGLEYDAWLEIERTGHVNEARIINTPDAYRKMTFPRESCRADSLGLAPSVQGRYVMSVSPTACNGPSQFAPVPYTTILPPRTRAIYAVIGPDGATQ